jgi:molecular chaperone DnaJ
MVEQDYYEAAGRPARGADEAAIKAAYRKLAMECHPDRHGGCTDKEAHFKAISEAYDVLKDPQKRAAYDRFGQAAFQNGGGGDPFGRRAAASRASPTSSRRSSASSWTRAAQQGQNAARGADLRYDLELSLEEAFAGVEKTITIEALARCEACTARGCTGMPRRAPAATCGGAGKVRAQQGFFVVERGCPTCRGSGETIADPVPACTAKAARSSAQAEVNIPPGSTKARASASPAKARRACAARQRRPLHVRPHEAARDLPARGHDAGRRCPVSFTTAALGGCDQPCPGSTATRSRSRSRPASSRASSCASAAPA